MAYDYKDDAPPERNPVREPAEVFSTSYQAALAIWIVPAIVVGMLMAGLNLRSYDTVLSINLEDGDDFLRTEQRKACGWPYVLASVAPSSRRWTLSGFGVAMDGIILLAAMVITAGTTRFIGACVDEEVSDPIPKQVRRLFRGRTKKVKSKRSAPSGRLSPSDGAPRVRRPKRPVDD